MLSKRWGVVGNPHTGYPDGTYARTVKLGWLRTLVLDFGSFVALYNQMPNETNIAVVLTGQTEGLNNDFRSPGWRDNFTRVVTEFCERFYRKVRLIEWTNEWDFWDNEDKAEKAAEIAILGTNICKKYGILGFLGSVASSDWKNQLERCLSIVSVAETEIGHKLIHGFCSHPYVSYVRRDRPDSAFIVPDHNKDGIPQEGWERLSTKIKEAIAIAGGRCCAVTEYGIKVVDAGGEADQALYVHASFEDELPGIPPHQLLMASLFCWHDANGSPGEQGQNGYGLIGIQDNLRPSYQAAAYQFQHDEQVDLPITQLLALTSATPVPLPEPEPEPQPVVVSAEQAHATRWRAVVADAEYNHTWGFERHWRRAENAWWGAPLIKHQHTYSDGRPLRIFTNAVVVYNEGADTVEVLHE